VWDSYAAPQLEVRCFMNSLHHSWKITTNYLETAYKLLPNEFEPETTKNHIEYIDNNELELAMSALDDLGTLFNASNEFWFQLEQAAINMEH
jgi:hypothetical protein